MEGVPPGFFGKSAKSVGGTGDRCGMKNERVRKQLKRKRVESEDGEKRESTCRRADIFRGVHPPVFAYVGEILDLRQSVAYRGESLDLGEFWRKTRTGAR